MPFLTEELVDLGHDVTLFASGDSTTRAELVAVRARARCAWTRAAWTRWRTTSRMIERGVRARATTSTSSTSTSTTSHFRAGPPAGGAARDDDARAAGHRRSCEPLFRTFADVAAGLDLGRAARAAAGRQLAGDRLPRPAARPVPAGPGARRLPRVPRADLAARSASTARSRSRGASGMPLEDRRQDRRQGSRLLRERDRAAVRRSAGRVRRRDRRGARRTRSWAARRRCCSRSTGRSRSAW